MNLIDKIEAQHARRVAETKAHLLRLAEEQGWSVTTMEEHIARRVDKLDEMKADALRALERHQQEGDS